MCPVDGCCSPYLTYHHFDPPWAEQRQHKVGGMIALCLQHHKEADGGAFTTEQLRRLKMSKSGKNRIDEVLCWQRQFENLLKAYRYALSL